MGDAGIAIGELEAKGFHQLPVRQTSPDEPFATPTGKVELYSTTLEDLGLNLLPALAASRHGTLAVDAEAQYPLTLITGDRERNYHHSRFRDQAWALKVSPDPRLLMHPEAATAYGVADGQWVQLEVAEGPGSCRLRVKLSEDTPRGIVNTGMGWWLPASSVPHHGALDVNINAALSYDGPYDPVTGSANIRGWRCRVVPLRESAT